MYLGVVGEFQVQLNHELSIVKCFITKFSFVFFSPLKVAESLFVARDKIKQDIPLTFLAKLGTA